MTATEINFGTCNKTGYAKRSVDCANCRYNRCINYPLFARTVAPNEPNKTLGTVCVGMWVHDRTIRQQQQIDRMKRM